MAELCRWLKYPPIANNQVKVIPIEASFCMVQPNANQLEEIAKLADAGKFKVNIDSEFTLDQVAQAHAKSETGRAKGKIIINVPE